MQNLNISQKRQLLFVGKTRVPFIVLIRKAVVDKSFVFVNQEAGSVQKLELMLINFILTPCVNWCLQVSTQDRS